jgi:hypothetical protein
MGGAVDAVSCRQTLCRVNAHFSSFQDALRFQEEAGMPERRKSMELQIADGQVDVEVMFARGSEGEP